MTTIQNLVKDFHETFNQPVEGIPHFPDTKEREMRGKLLTSEFREYIDAEYNNDLVNVAEELADMIYIIYGTAHSYGIPLDEVIKGIHKANMKKLWPDGKPRFQEKDGEITGKVIKPPNWKKSDTAKILKKHGFTSV